MQMLRSSLSTADDASVLTATMHAKGCQQSLLVLSYYYCFVANKWKMKWIEIVILLGRVCCGNVRM